MNILVFKTNLSSLMCVSNAGAYLNAHPYVLRWNVDLQDCDNILRVETEELQGSDIECILSKAGYTCEELQ